MKNNTSILFTILLFSINSINALGQECVDDDSAAAELAGMWNPSITGCEDAIPYLDSAGYPCSTDLTVLGMTGTIADICECTCENEEVLTCDEGYTLLTLSYIDADGTSFSVLNSSNELMAEYTDLNGSGSVEDCFLTSNQNDCFTIDIEGGQNFTWDLLVDDIVLLSGDASDFEFGPECDSECIDDDAAAAALAGMWNPSITGCEDAIPYLDSAGYPCITDLTVLGMTGTIADICECTCEQNLSILDINTHSIQLITVKDLLGKSITLPVFNKPIFFIYSDGSIEKRIIYKN